MTDPWISRWAAAWTGGAQRFNQNHAPAGSPAGGQFTTSGGGSGSSKGGSGGGGKKPTAHQQHAAHMQHLAGHPNSAQSRAARKAALLAQAKADRAKIAQLNVQLKGLKAQEAKAVAQAKANAAKAKSAKSGPNQSKSFAHAAAAKKPSSGAAPKHHLTLKQQIAAVEQQIATLTAQAKADEAAAAKL